GGAGRGCRDGWAGVGAGGDSGGARGVVPDRAGGRVDVALNLPVLHRRAESSASLLLLQRNWLHDFVGPGDYPTLSSSPRWRESSVSLLPPYATPSQGFAGFGGHPQARHSGERRNPA